MRSNLTLPQIHERSKKHSISQKWQSTEHTRKQDPYKLIESKLEAHQKQLERNNITIAQLTENFELVRSELLKQQQLNEQTTGNAKKMKEQVERLGKQLRVAKNRYEELEKQLVKEQEEHQKVVEALKREVSNGSQEEGAKLKRLEEEIGSLKKQNARLQAEGKSFKQDAERREKEIIQRYQQQKQTVSKELQISKNSLVDLQNKMKGLQGGKIASIELEKKLMNLQDELRGRENQLQVKNTEITALKDAKKQVELQLERAKKTAAAKSQQLQNLKQKVEENQGKISAFQKEKSSLEEKIKQAELATLSLKSQINKLSQELENSKQQLKKYIPSQVKLMDLMRLSGRLDQSQKTVQASVQCTFCKEQLKQPVTIIPCGHCFCLGCKKGYQKQCCKCGPKVKIDALYRNELMDDIVNMLKVVNSISSLLSGNTQPIK